MQGSNAITLTGLAMWGVRTVAIKLQVPHMAGLWQICPVMRLKLLAECATIACLIVALVSRCRFEGAKRLLLSA